MTAYDRRAALCAAVLLLPLGARAQTPPPVIDQALAPQGLGLEELVTLDFREDAQRRMGVEVRLEGKGPFSFLVDSASETSVLSEELARVLDLKATGAVTVAGFAGVERTTTARVRRLQVGDRKLDDASLPLLPRRHLGALGIIGLDALKGRRLDIDFGRRRIELSRSKGFLEAPDALVVRGRSKFGQLILVDSTVRSTPIYVVLDTGAEDTMGNDALRGLLYRRRAALGQPDPRRQVKLTSVTGQTIDGEADELDELRLGDIGLRRVPLVYAELDTFRRFGLQDKPALMLGMTTLRSFAYVTIDFARREVGFTLPAGGRET